MPETDISNTIIYDYYSTTYLDINHLPSKKNLVLRGVLDNSPWIALFGLLSMVLAIPLAALNVGVAVLVWAVLFVVFPPPLYYMSARDTKRQFIEAGGNPADYNYWCYAGMLPMGKRRGHEYKFTSPEELKKFSGGPFGEAFYDLRKDTRDRVFF